MHLDRYGDNYGDWDVESRCEAQQLLDSIIWFDFIIIFLLVYVYLSQLAGITVKPQGKTVDIIAAQQKASEVKADYASERENVDTGFECIYQQAVRMAEQVTTAPSKPRSAQRLRQ